MNKDYPRLSEVAKAIGGEVKTEFDQLIRRVERTQGLGKKTRRIPKHLLESARQEDGTIDISKLLGKK